MLPSAVAAQRAFHSEAELATARGAASRSALMMLSAGGSTGPEDVMRCARGAPVWQQIYPTDDWEVTRAVIERAQRAGCSAIVLTVDNHWPRYKRDAGASDAPGSARVHRLPCQQLARFRAQRRPLPGR